MNAEHQKPGLTVAFEFRVGISSVRDVAHAPEQLARRSIDRNQDRAVASAPRGVADGGEVLGVARSGQCSVGAHDNLASGIKLDWQRFSNRHRQSHAQSLRERSLISP